MAEAPAFTQLDQAIRAEMAAGMSPGLAAAVVHGPDLVWSAEYGSADVEANRPVGPSTRFVLGSVSKLFTALAIVQLRDAGKLDLDDRVTKHLPWFRLAGEDHPTITLRELLLQLGGLPRDPLGGSWEARTMPSREALIRDIPQEEQALPPETQWKYSNLGYAVLGLVVEAASGETYTDYVRRHILEPLGMNGTIVDPRPDTPDLAIGYGLRHGGTRERREFLATGGMLPAAGVASTARDMARFAGWMLAESDGPVLSAQSRREMLRGQAAVADGWAGQGLGFELRRVGGSVRIGHAGRAAGYAARLEIDPVHRLGVVVLANADDASPTRLADRAFALAAPAFEPAPTAATADPSWQRYVGTYVFGDGINHFALVDGRLAWVDPTAPDPAKSRIPLEPAGPDRFRFTAGGLIGETVTFEADSTGRIVRLHAGGTAYSRE